MFAFLSRHRSTGRFHMLLEENSMEKFARELHPEQLRAKIILDLCPEVRSQGRLIFFPPDKRVSLQRF